jgi:hypothetical protein
VGAAAAATHVAHAASAHTIPLIQAHSFTAHVASVQTHAPFVPSHAARSAAEHVCANVGGAAIGALDGAAVGEYVTPGSVGFLDGAAVGRVGCFVGALVGCFVGALVGCFVGALVGCFVGAAIGCFVGALVGCFVGALVGCFVGALVGCFVGTPAGMSDAIVTHAFAMQTESVSHGVPSYAWTTPSPTFNPE